MHLPSGMGGIVRTKGNVFIRVNVKALLIVLLLTVPLLLADFFLVMDRSRTELTSMIGDSVEMTAKSGAAQVARFVESRIRDVKLLTTLDELLSTAEQANRTARRRSEAARAERYSKINQSWETPAAAGVVSEVLANRSSIKLRDYLVLNRTIERIVVTDTYGATIAASHKPITYYDGDQAWWTRSFGDGRTGSVIVGEVSWDPVSFLQCWTVSAPMIDSGGEVSGIVRAFVSVGAMEPLFEGMTLGRGIAQLVERDGGVIQVRQASRQTKSEAEEMEVVAPLLNEKRSGFTRAELRGGREAFVGFAGVELAGVRPDFDWTVILTEDADELSAAVDSVNLRALGSAFLAILLLGAVAVYFTTHRPEEHAPMEEALHEVEAQEGIRTAGGQSKV